MGYYHFQIVECYSSTPQTDVDDFQIRCITVVSPTGECKCKQGIATWKKIEKEINSDFEISNDGGLMLAENQMDLEKLNMKI